MKDADVHAVHGERFEPTAAENGPSSSHFAAAPRLTVGEPQQASLEIGWHGMSRLSSLGGDYSTERPVDVSLRDQIQPFSFARRAASNRFPASSFWMARDR